MDRIIECVPNFSEGRRPEVVEQISSRIRSVPGVLLLDVETDADHNRAVVTFVGTPEAVGEAAFQAAREAARLIDMRRHRGEHPRIGATDVIPFVPVRGVTMADCVDLARSVGRRIGQELAIPVYLYEEAASRPERRNLADVRRGQYEGLAEEIGRQPERAPDFGPAELGPAGATAVGARPFLIAYNVYLGTPDLHLARHIARAVRHSSGGLRYVKALGIAVDRPGQVQVSMNLTDYTKTPIQRVLDLIRAEAGRYGVSVLESEVVGLLPAAALHDVAINELQLHNFRPDQILENRLQGEREGGLAADLPRPFLARVAAGTPTPGGGSVAAVAGANAAALGRMVANLTIGRKKYAAVEDDMRAVEAALEQLQQELLGLCVEDAAAFEAIMDSFRRPKGSDEEKATRSQAIQKATIEAARVPLCTAERTVQVLDLLRRAAAQGNPNAHTDAAVAVAMGRAAVFGAARNVRVNIEGLKDRALAEQLEGQISELEQRAEELSREVLGIVDGG
ncbi:MAG: glutamate formimidoyltransferase [Chloroflexia bacterium]|nr:glutamate formimidoyltransferase [Chloroflexia bacterium]